MSDTDVIILAILTRCDQIAAGFEELVPFLAPVLPVVDDDLARLGVVERIASIALLKRYEQLQDMLARLGRAYLVWELEPVARLTRRDFANHMEAMGFVADADDWVDYAELRNRLTHEYPIEKAEQVDRVNECWTAMPRLLAILAAMRARLTQRGLSL